MNKCEKKQSKLEKNGKEILFKNYTNMSYDNLLITPKTFWVEIAVLTIYGAKQT